MMDEITGITCPICGSFCDDLEVVVENNAIVEVRKGCAIAEAKFLGFTDHRQISPLIRKQGKLVPASLDEAITQCAEILVNAKYPCLYGWSNTSCEAIKFGMALAEEVGGIIDNTTTICHGPSILSIQDIGIPSCTLGQLRHRADLVIYWGSNPWSAHPRHIERYTAFSEGRFQDSEWRDYVIKSRANQIRKRILRASDLTHDRGMPQVPSVQDTAISELQEGRKMVVVDVRRTRTADIADAFIQIKPGTDYELLQAMRLLIRYEELEVDEVAGLPIDLLEDFADLLISCDFGVLFFGVGLTMSAGKHRNIDAALCLTRDLNLKTKFVIMPMRGHFNVTGANTVSTWQSGYPYAVDYSQGYPYYNPGETSITDILNRGMSDAALIIASDPVAHFPRASTQTLINHPLIVIDPVLTPTALLADVYIPSTFVGVETEGTAYRMDHVPLDLKKIVEPPTEVWSDDVILDRIFQKVQAIKEAQE
jgi:formylmethanofuran dehydrogenase subunit B